MNTTPLIDVMLVLLIMFIITIPSQTHAVRSRSHAMKLSTQLVRGTLALPMLLGFGVLAFAGAEPVTAQAAEPVVAQEMLETPVRATADAIAALPAARAEQVVLGRAVAGKVARLCESRVGPRVLLLSQAPGDLGPLAVRWSHPCRA